LGFAFLFEAIEGCHPIPAIDSARLIEFTDDTSEEFPVFDGGSGDGRSSHLAKILPVLVAQFLRNGFANPCDFGL
jgi:hypothetical protein